MNKKLLAFGLSIISFFCFCQIPNPSFESVTAGKPNGWNMGAVYSAYPIRDTLVSNSGNHAAAIYGSVPPDYNGAVVMDFVQVSNRPVALTGWYKFYPEGGDSLVFDVEVWKQGDYAGRAKNTFTSTIITGTNNVYMQFSVPINYATYTATTCDSAFISIYPTGNVSQYGYNWAHPNTIAIIDDLNWIIPIYAGIKEININEPINIENTSPNPSKDNVEIIYTVSEKTNVSLKLFDITGKEVLIIVANENQIAGRYKAIVNMNELKSGIYFYELRTSEGFKLCEKLIKE